MFTSYNPDQIEPKWQTAWEEAGLYKTSEAGDRPKFFCLDFFPYPSGEGLHVGHCRNYIPTDVISRYKRMQGFNVLHPMGWDAFGEPAEQNAVLHHVHPRQTTDENTANYRRQLRMIGTSYDWSREIDSSRPEFYRWTQWFFLQLYRRGLAYRDKNWQWWCPTCQTTLSSHEAAGGRCWRGHSGVQRREIPAWYFRITAYAEELIEGLDEIDWPDAIKSMQRNWIGRSEGCEIRFSAEKDQRITVFTTRPDTVFGVTFIALAPEHPLVSTLTKADQKAAVDAYREATIQLSEVERMLDSRPKTGIFTGSYAVNPINNEVIPIWIADYVLPAYAGGAVMGVPAHDQRDYEFARNYHLPIKVVISAGGGENPVLHEAITTEGRMVNSSGYNGMSSDEGAEKIASFLEAHDLGGKRVGYRMRDWLISRQRYWGTPIPIVHCERCGMVPVPVEQLPICLPYMDDYQPDGSGSSPLGRVPEFVHTTCPTCGGQAQRETDTMGGFACSSWYFLRFTSPQEANFAYNQQAMEYWMPVDLYVGGAEHATLHLLYARFWTKVLADAGLLPFREPFIKLMNQGQLLAPDGQRMSKTRQNTIPPDVIVERVGADALRIYSMFMAPFNQDIAWNTHGMIGARRFLNRVWKIYQDTYAVSSGATRDDLALATALHLTIRQVSERIEGFRFNTMISVLMEFLNLLYDRWQKKNWQTKTFHNALEVFMVLLAPAAPHIAEELWQLTGHPESVHQQQWPVWDEDLTRESTTEIAVQVDGKVRQVMRIEKGADADEINDLVRDSPKIKQAIGGNEIIKTVYIPGKIYNIVTTPNRKRG